MGTPDPHYRDAIDPTNGDRARERITNLADNVMASANVRCERANPSNLTSDEPDEFSRRR
jgi:hypothetical protein